MFIGNSARADISIISNTLGQFMSKFGEPHWISAKRVLRSLKGTRTHGFIICTLHKFFSYFYADFLAFTDADWGGCIDTFRSTSGSISSSTNILFSWTSKKANDVYLSPPQSQSMLMLLLHAGNLFG